MLNNDDVSEKFIFGDLHVENSRSEFRTEFVNDGQDEILIITTMTTPISWVDIIFFTIILFPNLLLELTVKDFIIFGLLAIPYRTYTPTPLSL